jgi:hypothetical protein
VLAVLVCVVITAGCSGDGDDRARPAPRPSPPNAATVDWVAGICVVEAAHRDTEEPPRLPPRPDEIDRAAVVGYLGTEWNRFDSAKRTLDRLGPSPAPGGEELIEAQRRALLDMLDTLAAHLNAAIHGPTADLATPLRLAADELADHSYDGPRLADLAERHPALAEAEELAPNC